MDAAAIEIRDLSKRYGQTLAVDGLTMDVQRGQVFGFLGPNGAGKTTSVKMLLGLTRPSGGGATVLGMRSGERDARRRIGYLPELFRYQAWLTGREVLRFHGHLAGVPPAQRDAEATRVLGLVGLGDAAERRSGGYSKGMQQRLGLAVALVGRPELLFLDEPTSALDPVGRVEVRELVRGLAAEGTTVFLNSHLLSEVEQVCHRVAIVDRGRVVKQGRLDELLGTGEVRVRGVAPDAAVPVLPGFQPMNGGDGILRFPNLEQERVPDLVAALVAAGFRVQGVEAHQSTLEDRFRELLSHS